MREPLAPGALRVPGEEAVEVVVVLRIGVDAAFVEARTIEQWDDHDRATHPPRVERAPETYRGLDAGVLRGVDAGGDHDGRSGRGARDRDERPAVLLEARVAGERERARYARAL